MLKSCLNDGGEGGGAGMQRYRVNQSQVLRPALPWCIFTFFTIRIETTASLHSYAIAEPMTKKKSIGDIRHKIKRMILKQEHNMRQD